MSNPETGLIQVLSRAKSALTIFQNRLDNLYESFLFALLRHRPCVISVSSDCIRLLNIFQIIFNQKSFIMCIRRLLYLYIRHRPGRRGFPLSCPMSCPSGGPQTILPARSPNAPIIYPSRETFTINQRVATRRTQHESNTPNKKLDQFPDCGQP